MTFYSIPAILSPCLQMETQPRCIPRYFCNKVERICAIYLISTLADCTLPLWKNDIFTLSFSLRECRNTMYFHTSIALVVIEEEKSRDLKIKNHAQSRISGKSLWDCCKILPISPLILFGEFCSSEFVLRIRSLYGYYWWKTVHVCFYCSEPI